MENVKQMITLFGEKCKQNRKKMIYFREIKFKLELVNNGLMAAAADYSPHCYITLLI